MGNVKRPLRAPATALYRGIARWNRLKQHDEDGNPIFEINPESDHVTYHDPSWRIVSDALGEAVDARFADDGRTRFVSKPGARAKYLLSGMLICPQCGGRFEAVNGRFYVCGTRRKSGTSVCSNPLSLRIDVFDEQVLGFLEGRVLHPTFVNHVVELACGNAASVEREEIEQRIEEVNRKLRGLTKVAEQLADDAPEELAEQMRARKAERETLIRRLAALDAPADRERLRAALEQRVADWRARLRADHPDEARFVVKQLLGPITLWTEAPIPEELRGYVVQMSTPPEPGTTREGADDISFKDCGFSAVVTPAGLINGLGAQIVVAGARPGLSRRLCWTAA